MQKQSGLGEGGGNCRAYAHICTDADLAGARGYSYIPADWSEAIVGWGLPTYKAPVGGQAPRVNPRVAKAQLAERDAEAATGGVAAARLMDRDEALAAVGLGAVSR